MKLSLAEWVDLDREANALDAEVQSSTHAHTEL